MQIQSQGAVLVIRACLHNHVLRVMGHGSQNKWMETAASKWTQEMRDAGMRFYLNPTSGSIYSDALRTFCFKVLGKTSTLFTEYYKCCIWLKGPTPLEIFNTFILEAVQRQMAKASVSTLLYQTITLTNNVEWRRNEKTQRRKTK